MKIYYILKKGLQCYPPCLAQVLSLYDAGIELEVYHGRNSDYVNALLDERGISHHSFATDRDSSSRLESYKNFVSYTAEARRIISSIPTGSILWFGNCESAMTLGKCIRSYRFVLTVLELYTPGSMYDKLVRRMIPYAEKVICCEKHRAVIMKERYSMKERPFIIPNKPYELKNINSRNEKIEMLKKNYAGKKFVLYQGIVQRDRPIDNIANALNEIGDDELTLLVMGKADTAYAHEIKDIYPNTIMLGYIPAPEHLEVTALSYIGIAIYDDSNLNNEFCAPNKIYEYASYGIPMISSENLGLTETVGAYGAAECINFRDTEAVKEAIIKIKNDYDSYSRGAQEFYSAVDCPAIIREIAGELEP